MKPLRRLFSLAIALATPLAIMPNSALADDKIISIGGSVTEVVYALGEESRLVARDTTSSFPAAANALPDVGYMRRLSPEGVLSVEPTMIIAEEGSGPQETIDVLEAANIPFIIIPDGFDRPSVVAKIEAVAKALGVSEKGAALVDHVDAELAEVEQKVNAYSGKKKKVMFILSTRGGKIMAAGINSSADAIIRLAGGENVFTEFQGYKTVSDESVSTSGADVILMMASRGNSSGHGAADEELLAMPALQTTPAAQNKAVIRMDGLLLLGFGPRVAEAVSDLHKALYGHSHGNGESHTH